MTQKETFPINNKQVVLNQGGEWPKNFICGPNDNSISLLDLKQVVIDHIKYGHIKNMLM